MTSDDCWWFRTPYLLMIWRFFPYKIQFWGVILDPPHTPTLKFDVINGRSFKTNDLLFPHPDWLTKVRLGNRYRRCFQFQGRLQTKKVASKFQKPAFLFISFFLSLFLCSCYFQCHHLFKNQLKYCLSYITLIVVLTSSVFYYQFPSSNRS